MTTMLRLLPNSRQTRRTIWSGVSVKGLCAAGSRPARMRLVSLPAATFSRSRKAWKLVMTTLARLSRSISSARHDVELAVVVVGVVGQQHAQAVADGDARRHDEERVAEAGVLRVLDLVERVPGDEHRHDHRLAAARGHLEGHAVELGVGRLVGLAQPVGQVLLARALRDALGEVDRRLDRLDLAEEEAAVAVAPLPVLEQAARRARDARVVAPAPVADGRAHLVDVVVLAQPVVGPLGAELELLALLLGLRDGDEVGAGAARRRRSRR